MAMYATIIEWTNGYHVRSSFFQDLEDAIDYAVRMPGIVAVEEISGEIVWKREATKQESKQ